MNWQAILLPALGGLLSAARVDLSAYSEAIKRAKETNEPRPVFDWGIALPRWIEGVFWGLSVGLGAEGINAAVEA